MFITFYWQGRQRGIYRCGYIKAYNKRQAKLLLIKQGIVVSRLSYRWIFWRGQKAIAANDMSYFLQQLASLLAAGIDLLSALALLSSYHYKPHLQQWIGDIMRQLNAGQSFSSSLLQYPQYIDDLSCQLIAVGEQTGHLSEMLYQAVRYRFNREALRQKIISICFYPVIVIIVASIVTLMLLIVVIPQFKQLFIANNASLPVITQAVLAVSNFLSHYFLLLLTVIITVVLALLTIRRWWHPFSIYTDVAMLKLPIVGSLISRVVLARCCQTLAISFAAGIPLPQGLLTSANVTKNSVFVWTLGQVEKKLRQGQSLAQSMAEWDVFPAFMISMIASGENNGNLDKMLLEISKRYSDDLQRFSERFGQLLEPVIMVTLGAIIAILLLAIYLPMFDLGNAIL